MIGNLPSCCLIALLWISLEKGSKCVHSSPVKLNTPIRHLSKFAPRSSEATLRSATHTSKHRRPLAVAELWTSEFSTAY